MMDPSPKTCPTKTELAEGTVLLFDKPYGWTSFDVIGKIRNLLKRQLGLRRLKIGHAGTLDPLATGLLVVCTGKMTRSVDVFQDTEKEYTGTFRLGQVTPSYDLETGPCGEFPVDHIDMELAERMAMSFTGEISQVPPLYSAKKVDGERAYEIARRGEFTRLESKRGVITEFSILRFELPEIDFRVVCSKGTYIRSLAHDYGMALKSGAYLKNLRRTRSGDFHVEDAWNIEDFSGHITQLAAAP